MCTVDSTALLSEAGKGSDGLGVTWHGIAVDSPAVCRLSIRNKGLRDVAIADFQGKPLIFTFERAEILGFIGGPAPRDVVSETSRHQVIIQPSFIRGRSAFHIDFMVDGACEITGFDNPILNVDLA